MKNFNCTFEAGEPSKNEEFIFEGQTPEQAKFYVFQHYTNIKNLIVKEI